MSNPAEIVILSGKGGTGKTSVSAAFMHLASQEAEVVCCDVDVDAPDLHIILAPEVEEEHPFHSGEEAFICADTCTGCGLCKTHCAYGAVTETNGVYAIDQLRCEGCMVCRLVCPAQGVTTAPRHCGTHYRSQTRFGTLFHAQLFPGQENSGRLVALLKQRARQWAVEHGVETILYDGSPGIGCPVISSLSGASMAVIVSEPTPTGRHDLERVTALCAHFRIPLGVLINKCDIHSEASQSMADWCAAQGHAVLGMLPFNKDVVRAMLERRAVTELDVSAMVAPLADAWCAVNQYLHHTILPVQKAKLGGLLQESLS